MSKHNPAHPHPPQSSSHMHHQHGGPIGHYTTNPNSSAVKVSSSRPPSSSRPGNIPSSSSSASNNADSRNVHQYLHSFEKPPKGVEQLSATLGYPDMYLVLGAEAKKHPEFAFTGFYAEEGYKDDSIKALRINQYGSFVHHQTQTTQSSFDAFFRKLDDREETLREACKSFSTKKTREEKKAMYHNAVKACQCTNPKVNIPSLLFTDKERWINNLAASNSLRELASSVPHGYRVKNVIDVLVAHDVPLFRATWFIKCLCLYQFKDRTSQQWTETIIGYLNELYSRKAKEDSETSVSSLQRSEVLYVLELSGWCCEQGLVDMEILEQWYAAKLEDITDKTSAQKSSATKSSTGPTDGSFLDSYFSSPSAIASLDANRTIDDLLDFIEKRSTGGTYCTEIMSYVTRFLVNSNNYSQSIPRLLQTIQKKNVKATLLKEVFTPQLGASLPTEFPSNFLFQTLDSFLDHGNVDKIISIISKHDNNISIPYICEWASTLKRYNRLRPLIAGQVFLKLQKQESAPYPLQSYLFKYLSGLKADLEHAERVSVVHLFAELIRLKIFSHEGYVRSCISRGFLTHPVHKFLIQNLPIFQSDANIDADNQRNTILYGANFKSDTNYIQQTEQTNYYKNLVCQYVLGETDKTADVLACITPETASLYTIYDISEHLHNFAVYNLQNLREEHLYRTLFLIEYSGNIRCIVNLLKMAMETSTSFNAFIFMSAFNHQDAFIAANEANKLSQLIAERGLVNHDQRHSTLPTAATLTSFAEDILRQMAVRHQDIFRYENIKQQYPQLNVCIDGIVTNPVGMSRPSEASAFLNSGEKLSAQVLGTLNGFKDPSKVDDVARSLRSLSRKDVFLTFRYCLEQFEASFQQSYAKAIGYVQLLRELYALGSFTANDFCEFLTLVFLERLSSSNYNAAKNIAAFTVSSLCKGLLSFDSMVDYVIEHTMPAVTSKKMIPGSVNNLYFWFFRVFLISGDSTSPAPSGTLFYELSIPYPDQYLFEQRRTMYSVKSIQKVTRLLTNLCVKSTNEMAEPLLGLLSEFLMDRQGFVERVICKDEFLRQSFVDMSRIPYEKQHKQKVLSKLFSALYSLQCGITQFDIDFQTSSVDQLVQFIWQLLSVPSPHHKFTIWLHSFLLQSFLFNLRRRESLNQETTNKFLNYLTSYQTSNETNSAMSQLIQPVDEQYILYGDVMADSMKQNMELRRRLEEKFNNAIHVQALLAVPKPAPQAPQSQQAVNSQNNAKTAAIASITKELFDKAANDRWILGFQTMSHILIEMMRTDSGQSQATQANQNQLTSDALCKNVSTYLQALLRIGNKLHLFEQENHVGSNDHTSAEDAKQLPFEAPPVATSTSRLLSTQPFRRLQQRVLVCMTLLTHLSSMMKTVPFVMLEVLLSLLKNRIATTPLIVKKQAEGKAGSKVEVVIMHDYVHTLLCQLQKDPKLHNQVNMFFERRRSSKSAKEAQPSALPTKKTPNPAIAQSQEGNNWRLIEDFVAVCSNCNAKHGHLTPAMFGGKPVRRTQMLFEQTEATSAAGVPPQGMQQPAAQQSTTATTTASAEPTIKTPSQLPNVQNTNPINSIPPLVLNIPSTAPIPIPSPSHANPLQNGSMLPGAFSFTLPNLKLNAQAPQAPQTQPQPASINDVFQVDKKRKREEPPHVPVPGSITINLGNPQNILPGNILPVFNAPITTEGPDQKRQKKL